MFPDSSTDPVVLRRDNDCLRRQIENLEKADKISKRKLQLLQEKLSLAEDVKAGLIMTLDKQANSSR